MQLLVQDEDTRLGFCYTGSYAKAKTTATNWSNKFNNAKDRI